MPVTKLNRFAIIAAVALIAGALAGSNPAAAIDTESPATPAATQGKAEKKPGIVQHIKKRFSKKKNQEKKSEQEFFQRYRAAHALIYKEKNFAAGIVALHAIGHDEHPDVANLLGFASRKLGDYDQAKYWYEAALAADPKHTRTWHYYGLWHLEQGNRLKAEDHLEKIHVICGNTTCEDYTSLKAALDAGATSY